MKFIPKYTVQYNGIWYNAGETIVISPSDEDELRQHGEIIKEDEPAKPEEKELSKAGNNDGC